MIIDVKSPEEARKQIEKLSKEKKQVLVLGKSIDFNRVILENKRVNILILSHTNKKDMLKQRDSGLNHVLCNLASKNKITLAFDFSELKAEKKEKALILARWMQNIKLMRKSKNKIKLINTENIDERDLFSFLLTLGANTQQATMAVS